ncbi:hypothetical protein BLNAU_24486 [Blattamonas nauphoetae]|uniref:Uncharacterized protein n=1 Tax=Blattamonas nauphoetae TaxID=2049346 RepID=A0ABQ9WMM4_9EUKA|nr:hypothetical protein BLNAU_24486 [Blattamonas nauphoetae]
MIEISSGLFEIRDVDVVIESIVPSFVLLSAIDSTIILRDGSIVGVKTRNDSNSDELRCEWGTGALQHSVLRKERLSWESEWRRRDSGIPSAWISATDCVVGGATLQQASSHFIPTLSSTSTSSFNKKDKTVTLEMIGTTLIPCSLMLEVYEKKSDGKKDWPNYFHSLRIQQVISTTQQ